MFPLLFPHSVLWVFLRFLRPPSLSEASRNHSRQSNSTSRAVIFLHFITASENRNFTVIIDTNKFAPQDVQTILLTIQLDCSIHISSTFILQCVDVQTVKIYETQNGREIVLQKHIRYDITTIRTKCQQHSFFFIIFNLFLTKNNMNLPKNLSNPVEEFWMFWNPCWEPILERTRMSGA